VAKRLRRGGPKFIIAGSLASLTNSSCSNNDSSRAAEVWVQLMSAGLCEILCSQRTLLAPEALETLLRLYAAPEAVRHRNSSTAVRGSQRLAALASQDPSRQHAQPLQTAKICWEMALFALPVPHTGQIANSGFLCCAAWQALILLPGLCFPPRPCSQTAAVAKAQLQLHQV